MTKQMYLCYFMSPISLSWSSFLPTLEGLMNCVNLKMISVGNNGRLDGLGNLSSFYFFCGKDKQLSILFKKEK